MKGIAFKVNGIAHSFTDDPEMPLLWYLRDHRHLTGTNFGCGEGLCGACTVQIDGAAARSCITSMASQGCLPLHPPSATPCSPPPASASASYL